MKVDWKSFISQHDLIYEDAPKMWADGFPIGNGALGSLAYVPYDPEWLINKNDVYDYRIPEMKLLKHSEYLEMLNRGATHQDINSVEAASPEERCFSNPKSCAVVRFRFGHDRSWVGPHAARARLSLYSASVRFELDKHMSHPRFESFISKNEDVLAIRVKDISWPISFFNKVELLRHEDVLLPRPRFGSEEGLIWLDQKMPEGFRYAVAVRVVPKDGRAWKWWTDKNWRPKYHPKPSRTVRREVISDRTFVTVGGDCDIFVALVTNNEAADPLEEAKRLARAVAEKGYERLFLEHRREWRDFWKKSFLKLDNPFLEQLWYFSLYQLASSYGKAPVPGLCSLWYGPDETEPTQVLPWHGLYTNDQNSEMPPMPLFSANHPELAESFYETFNRMIPGLKETTKELTGLDGVWLPLRINPKGQMDLGGGYRYIHVGGPYHGVIYSWGYRYTKDLGLLREKIYPFLREVCIFFSEYMTFDKEKGRYRLWPSVPAELPTPNAANPTQTLTLLKVCLRQAIEAAEILGVDADWRKRWEHLLGCFPEYPVEKGVILEAENIPPEHYTSEYGALYTVFPAGEYGADSPPEICQLVRRTYENFRTRFISRSYADVAGSHFFNGWTWFFADMVAVRMGWKEEAWRLFWNQPLRCHLKPNGLFTHNAFAIADPKRSEANLKNIPRVKVLDGKEWMKLSEPMFGNSGGECTPDIRAKEWVFPVHEMSSAYLMFINETLLQSYGGLVRVFPCVPDGFTGAFQNFRAEGAFLVSAAMKKGRPDFVEVQSLKGGPLRLLNPWPRRRVLCLKGKNSISVRGEELRFEMRKGEALFFCLDKRARERQRHFTFKGERKASPKCIMFDDGSFAWLGKPDPSLYYAGMLPRE